MTTLQLYETIQQTFPNIGQAQILLDIDTSQKKFAADTGILTAVGALSTIATNHAWTLPTKFKKLLDVAWYDASNEPVYQGESSFQIAYEIEFDKFFVYSTTSTPITGVPTAASTGYLHYEEIPTTITSTSTAMEVPAEYRDAIESDIFSKYFAKFPTPIGSRDGNVVMGINIRAAQWHRQEYDRVRLQAKRDFRSREHTEGEVITYDHAGKYALPRRARDTSQGTTAVSQITALTALYEKYVAFTATTPSTLTETVAQIGYSAVAGTISSNTLALTSSAEFGKDTQFVCNDTRVSLLWNSTSSMTVTFPSGWNTIAIEIYERV